MAEAAATATESNSHFALLTHMFHRETPENRVFPNAANIYITASCRLITINLSQCQEICVFSKTDPNSLESRSDLRL
jgi:hypothetical protein